MYTTTVPDDLSLLPPSKSWPQQGQWRYDDYLRLPDDGLRYEVIKGVLYMANAPSFAHQYAVNKISMALTTSAVLPDFQLPATTLFLPQAS